MPICTWVHGFLYLWVHTRWPGETIKCRKMLILKYSYISIYVFRKNAKQGVLKWKSNFSPNSNNNNWAWLKHPSGSKIDSDLFQVQPRQKRLCKFHSQLVFKCSFQDVHKSGCLVLPLWGYIIYNHKPGSRKRRLISIFFKIPWHLQPSQCL